LGVAEFEDFLKSYKSSSTDATDALGDLNLEEDGLSDEYDFMDDVEDGVPGHNTRRRQQDNSPKLKYMKILQEVANRAKDQIVVEMDDLRAVSVFVAHDWNSADRIIV